MTEADVVLRALSVIGKGCVYKLGRGGLWPEAAFPWNKAKECDCSGFAAWAIGVSRQTSDPWYRKMNGGWLETTAIFRDCAEPFGSFDGVEWHRARPGMLIVYGDRTDPVTGKKSEGHVGIVSAVDESGPTNVIHCSSGNFRTTGDAIRETSSLLFRTQQARIARCGFIEAA